MLFGGAVERRGCGVVTLPAWCARSRRPLVVLAAFEARCDFRARHSPTTYAGVIGEVRAAIKPTQIVSASEEHVPKRAYFVKPASPSEGLQPRRPQRLLAGLPPLLTLRAGAIPIRFGFPFFLCLQWCLGGGPGGTGTGLGPPPPEPPSSSGTSPGVPTTA